MLDKILEIENLTAAWLNVSSGGETPGVDDWSLRRFGRQWEENLRALAAETAANRYQPSRLRVVYIPKRSGGQRRLGIPTVRDRVLQRAALQVLEWRYERKFMSCSYGYRPKRSLFKAVAAVMGYRDRGLHWVVDADIDDCFDSLDHELLLSLLKQDVTDARVLRLLGQWLQAGMVDRRRRKGVSQGMPISPLLCNVYLHELDCALAWRGRLALVRYADDFIILARTREDAETCLEMAAATLAGLELQLEPSKTRVTSFDEGFEFLGVSFQGDSYSYTWQDKRVEVKGAKRPPWALWDYFPHGYE